MIFTCINRNYYNFASDDGVSLTTVNQTSRVETTTVSISGVETTAIPDGGKSTTIPGGGDNKPTIPGVGGSTPTILGSVDKHQLSHVLAIT